MKTTAIKFAIKIDCFEVQTISISITLELLILEHWPGTPDLGIWKMNFWKFYLHLNILNLLWLIFRFLVVKKWRFLCDKNVHRRGNFLCLRYVHGGTFGIFWITGGWKNCESTLIIWCHFVQDACFWWRATLVDDHSFEF